MDSQFTCPCGATFATADMSPSCPQCGRAWGTPELARRADEETGFSVTAPPPPRESYEGLREQIRRRERAAPPETVARSLTIRAQELLTIRAGTLKAVEALESRITPEEQATIIGAADRALTAPAAALALLHMSLDDLESAGLIISDAMLR